MIPKSHHQVPRLLGHPLPRRVRGDTGQVHPPRAVLDEEQHMQAAQEHGIDMEEVHRQDRLRLGLQEHPSAISRSPGCGIDAPVLEDLPHRRRREPTLPGKADVLEMSNQLNGESAPTGATGSFSIGTDGKLLSPDVPIYEDTGGVRITLQG